MVAAVLIHENGRTGLEELLRPAPWAPGPAPEQRVVFCGVSWNQYLSFDKKLGDDRPSPRLYYLDGELEIMTTSSEHERIKKWIGDLLAVYFEEAGLEVTPRGQATMRAALKAAGAEPDESWCIGDEKPIPDLALEVVLTSGGIRKLEVYRRFKVPEVWFWRRGKLELFVLESSGNYRASSKSRLLPALDVVALARCAKNPSWLQARRNFRAALAKATGRL
jgi:Uma2 family endonuclease